MKIDKDTAKRIYPEAQDWFKKELEKEFGAAFFIPNYYENIRTVEDAFKKTGTRIEDIFNEKDSTDEKAYKLLKVVVRAINMKENGDVWEPDFTNNDQYKYYPWFDLSSGFGFSYSYYHCARTFTIVGSRLCFETKEQCIYAANQFIGLYEDFLTVKK